MDTVEAWCIENERHERLYNLDRKIWASIISYTLWPCELEIGTNRVADVDG
jgi:hypothetical protein